MLLGYGSEVTVDQENLEFEAYQLLLAKEPRVNPWTASAMEYNHSEPSDAWEGHTEDEWISETFDTGFNPDHF